MSFNNNLLWNIYGSIQWLWVMVYATQGQIFDYFLFLLRPDSCGIYSEWSYYYMFLVYFTFIFINDIFIHLILGWYFGFPVIQAYLWMYFHSLKIFVIFSSLHERESLSVVSNSLGPHGIYSTKNSLGQNPGVSSLSLFQGIFPTQGSNPGLPHCRQIL